MSYSNLVKNLVQEVYDLQSTHKRENHTYRSTGVDDNDYYEFVDFIEEHNPRCIIEYGSGYSTYFIKEYINRSNYNIKFKSFECDSNYYNALLEQNMGLENYIELTDIVCLSSPVPFQAGCKFKHSLDGLEEVDIVIVDGPGWTGYEGCNCDINMNVEWIEQELNRSDIKIWVDGRTHQMYYYDCLDKEDRVLNFLRPPEKKFARYRPDLMQINL